MTSNSSSDAQIVNLRSENISRREGWIDPTDKPGVDGNKYTPEEDVIILESRAAGVSWREIALLVSEGTFRRTGTHIRMRWTQLMEKSEKNPSEPSAEDSIDDNVPAVSAKSAEVEEDNGPPVSSTDLYYDDAPRSEDGGLTNGKSKVAGYPDEHAVEDIYPNKRESGTANESSTTTSLPDDVASIINTLAQCSPQPIVYSPELSAAHPSANFSSEDDQLIFQCRRDGATWTEISALLSVEAPRSYAQVRERYYTLISTASLPNSATQTSVDNTNFMENSELDGDAAGLISAGPPSEELADIEEPNQPSSRGTRKELRHRHLPKKRSASGVRTRESRVTAMDESVEILPYTTRGGKVLRDETDSSHKVSRNRNSGFTSVEDEIILESRENNASWKSIAEMISEGSKIRTVHEVRQRWEALQLVKPKEYWQKQHHRSASNMENTVSHAIALAKSSSHGMVTRHRKSDVEVPQSSKPASSGGAAKRGTKRPLYNRGSDTEDDSTSEADLAKLVTQSEFSVEEDKLILECRAEGESWEEIAALLSDSYFIHSAEAVKSRWYELQEELNDKPVPSARDAIAAAAKIVRESGQMHQVRKEEDMWDEDEVSDDEIYHTNQESEAEAKRQRRAAKQSALAASLRPTYHRRDSDPYYPPSMHYGLSAPPPLPYSFPPRSRYSFSSFVPFPEYGSASTYAPPPPYVPPAAPVTAPPFVAPPCPPVSNPMTVPPYVPPAPPVSNPTTAPPYVPSAAPFHGTPAAPVSKPMTASSYGPSPLPKPISAPQPTATSAESLVGSLPSIHNLKVPISQSSSFAASDDSPSQPSARQNIASASITQSPTLPVPTRQLAGNTSANSSDLSGAEAQQQDPAVSRTTFPHGETTGACMPKAGGDMENANMTDAINSNQDPTSPENLNMSSYLSLLTADDVPKSVSSDQLSERNGESISQEAPTQPSESVSISAAQVSTSVTSESSNSLVNTFSRASAESTARNSPSYHNGYAESDMYNDNEFAGTHSSSAYSTLNFNYPHPPRTPYSRPDYSTMGYPSRMPPPGPPYTPSVGRYSSDAVPPPHPGAPPRGTPLYSPFYSSHTLNPSRQPSYSIPRDLPFAAHSPPHFYPPQPEGESEPHLPYPGADPVYSYSRPWQPPSMSAPRGPADPTSAAYRQWYESRVAPYR